MQTFLDVPIMPTRSFHGKIPGGGPIWPDFAQQKLARHRRNDRVKDKLPPYEDPVEIIAQDCTWGGFLEPHFGHAMAEHLPRLLNSFDQRPGDLYAFTLPRRYYDREILSHFQQVFDWIGLRKDQIKLIKRPCLAKRLHVAAQAETLGGLPPDAAYLDRLGRYSQNHDLKAQEISILYVSRAGFIKKGLGNLLGEDFLIHHFERFGIKVIEPAQFSLHAQMKFYQNAKKIIFMEGSAVHGRQLLGHLPQDIHILTRRKGNRICENGMRPRCDHLYYHDTAVETFSFHGDTGFLWEHLAVSLMDLTAVFAFFHQLGIDIAPDWDMTAYQQSVKSDLSDWLAFHFPNQTPPSDLLDKLRRFDIFDELSPRRKTSRVAKDLVSE